MPCGSSGACSRAPFVQGCYSTLPVQAPYLAAAAYPYAAAAAAPLSAPAFAARAVTFPSDAILAMQGYTPNFAPVATVVVPPAGYAAAAVGGCGVPAMAGFSPIVAANSPLAPLNRFGLNYYY